MKEKIDVRFEPDHEAISIRPGTAQLTWGWHPAYGNGWTLHYLDDPGSATAGVEEWFTPGDLGDVDEALRSAEHWLALTRASNLSPTEGF